MNTEVRMPQLGESIAEGTIVKWFKSVGDFVRRDESLFEITTDKVDTEVPAPGDGYVTRIVVQEGETVPINTLVCILGDEVSEESQAAPHAGRPGSAESPEKAPVGPAGSTTLASAAPGGQGGATVSAVPSRAERLRIRSSPLVRRLAAESGVNLPEVAGTGADGRVTRDDLAKHLRERSVEPAPAGALAGRLEPMSPMRRRIADHMVMSRRTSAHVTTVFEVDMSHVRERKSVRAPGLLEEGTKMTFLPFIVGAVCDALKRFPVLNASVEGGSIRYHDDINMGIAVALDEGLIVPVVKSAGSLSLEEMARRIQDLARRARAKKLKPEEVQSGTFTITNPGVFGALTGTPIINQPQVGILCVGKIEKRPVVLSGGNGKDGEVEDGDTIAIRTMTYLSLSYDHRVIDGAVADQFLSDVKRTLEISSPDVGDE